MTCSSQKVTLALLSGGDVNKLQLDAVESEAENVTSDESESEDEQQEGKEIHQQTQASQVTASVSAQDTDHTQTSSAPASDDSIPRQPDVIDDVTVVRDDDTSSQAYEPLVSEQPPAKEPAAADEQTVAIDSSESTASSDSEGYTHLQVERETSAPAYESLQGECLSKKFKLKSFKSNFNEAFEFLSGRSATFTGSTTITGMI